MSVNRNEIIKFCEEYLKVDSFEDYCVNGLQVEGVEKVNKIITGVSLSQKLIEEAVNKKAKMIIVHHGIFSRDIVSPLKLKGVWRNRLKLLLENNINLAGFHLPLDAHPEIGNNVGLCKLLGIKNIKSFFVGFWGELEKPIKLEEFVNKVDESLNTNSFVLKNNNKKVHKIGVVSGGAPEAICEAADLGVDVYLTGEIKESIVRTSEELKVNFVAAGHYNTEKLGVQNLGKKIVEKFGIKVEFIDIPCDV